jgi:HPt (histidine-containing phosphotransfer) domain-containing protein
LPPSLSGFDIASAQKRLGGNGRLLADLLRTFAAEHGACAADIDQLLREQRLATAAAALHRVKGAAHIVGAESVAAAAQALEDDVRHGRRGDIAAFAHALSDAVENIRQHVAAVPVEKDIGAVDAYKS